MFAISRLGRLEAPVAELVLTPGWAAPVVLVFVGSAGENVRQMSSNDAPKVLGFQSTHQPPWITIFLANLSELHRGPLNLKLESVQHLNRA